MNFKKLYYPTAELANSDPNFVASVLSDDEVLIELTLEPTDNPNIIVSFDQYVLFEGIIRETLVISQTIPIGDWTKTNLLINLLNNKSVKITRCKLQHINVLQYPLTELFKVYVNGDVWIDVTIEKIGHISLAVTNPICLWANTNAPDIFNKSGMSTLTPEETTEYNKQIEHYLSRLL